MAGLGIWGATKPAFRANGGGGVGHGPWPCVTLSTPFVWRAPGLQSHWTAEASARAGTVVNATGAVRGNGEQSGKQCTRTHKAALIPPHPPLRQKTSIDSNKSHRRHVTGYMRYHMVRYRPL